MARQGKTHDTDILISGGGIAGLTLALILGKAGIGVTVIDREKLPKSVDQTPDGTRTAALMQNAIAVLERTGAWTRCTHRGETMQTLQIIDDSKPNKAPLPVKFHAHDIGQERFGVNMPLAPLRAALSEEFKTVKNLTYIESPLTHFDTDSFGVTAQLENGTTLRAKLIVGADGRRSKVREIAGIGYTEHDCKQMAITCLLDHTKPHHFISTEFHRPTGPFTLVPLPKNRSSLVWVEPTDTAQDFLAMSKPAFTRAVQDRTDGILGEITLATPPQGCPLITQIAKTLTAPRTALIAEAAHVIHPIGAQGLNLSLCDVAALADLLIEAKKIGLDVGSQTILQRYERTRRTDILLRSLGNNGLNKIVSNDFGLLATLRRFGLIALDAFPPLKSLVMRKGMMTG